MDDHYLWDWDEDTRREELLEEEQQAKTWKKVRSVYRVRRRERKARILRGGLSIAALLFVIVFAALSLPEIFSKAPDSMQADNSSMVLQNYVDEELESSVSSADEEPDTEPLSPYSVFQTERTQEPPEDVVSQYVLLIDMENHAVLTAREPDAIIYPASMTKILTILTAADEIERRSDLHMTDTVTIDLTITDYCYLNDCSSVGYKPDEQVAVRELFYGTILPSGADAAVALANYTAGSHEAFVTLMNEKATELGLSETAHFTNCVGLFDENHYCTITDMAVILQAALENEFCKEVLSAHTYTTAVTEQHPEGISLSNWFLRRIEDKVENGFEVLSAKTGYVEQSGNCAASYAETADGHGYLCVTAMSSSSWRCIYDHVSLYAPYMT